MPRKARNEYTGILTEPIDYAEAEDVVVQELQSRVDALFAHYRIEDGNLLKLVLALAEDWVPGFKPVPQRGRKADLINAFRDGTVFEQLGAAESAGKSLRAAAQRLAAQWTNEGYPVKASTLRKRYEHLKAADGRERGKLLGRLQILEADQKKRR